LEDATGKVLVYGLTATQVESNDKSFASLKLRDGDTVTLIGTRDDYNGTAQVGGPAYYVSHIAAPYLQVSKSAITVESNATSAEFTVDANVTWTASCESANCEVTDNKVVVTFNENETSDPVEYVVTISSELGETSVTITQKAVLTSDANPRDVKVTEDLIDWSGKYLIVFGENAHATISNKDLISTQSVNIVADEIAATTELESAVMTVAKKGDKYTMTYPDGKFFSMVKNGSASSQTSFDLTFAYTDSGVKISGVSSGTTYILYHNSNNGNFYRCYVEKNQSGYSLPQLYKYTE
jgi:hypothetical protein